MNHPPLLSRRGFLQKTGLLAAATGLGRLGSINAHAQTAPADYKALVCVFMLGGNDGHNMIVPLAGPELTNYRNARGSLALPDGNTQVLPVSALNGTPYGLNGGLASIHPLWAQGKLAVMANVGMLVRPTTRAQYQGSTVGLPTNLFSHSDQVISMQAGDPNGSGGSGWAGRIADATRAMNAASTFPPAISVAGQALFCSGNVVQSTSLIPGFDLSANGLSAWPASAAAAKVQALQEIVTFNSGLALVQAANDVRADGLELNGMLTGLGSGSVATVFPGTGIGQQLKQVAQIIRLRAATGMNRQVFFCALGGFDTHSAQSWAHMDLLRQLADGMAAFYNATAEMGIADKVTTFTASEFGRTLQPSGSGTDHGWGNHQLIMGGAVRGGELYGTFPSLALGGPEDTGSRGVLIPTTSLDQFGGTIARWFGVAPEAMPSVFPNLGNFATPDLGFVA
ncbi:DUF1501 domain-containing protein [Horticoccus sp. 23ND18S-11]|uniref:DUF1501 domain-containing protein n=1 Tax=Horticoccus sp. 23ND18S-11 TaxID=3391832 RepID=UPI0039C8F7F3